MLSRRDTLTNYFLRAITIIEIFKPHYRSDSCRTRKGQKMTCTGLICRILRSHTTHGEITTSRRRYTILHGKFKILVYKFTITISNSCCSHRLPNIYTNISFKIIYKPTKTLNSITNLKHRSLDIYTSPFRYSLNLNRQITQIIQLLHLTCITCLNSHSMSNHTLILCFKFNPRTIKEIFIESINKMLLN